MKAKYKLVLVMMTLAISGCQNSALNRNLDEEQKIYIHETTKNYGGLIELYKNQLKINDNPETRFKLARVYYLSLDYSAAYRALSTVVDTTNNDNYLVLYSNILYKQAKYPSALVYLQKSLVSNPKNGEAYNLKGIVEVRLGQFDVARSSFNKARELFYDENKVINNIAMLSILNGEYEEAYNELNRLYTKGYRNEVLLHNILFTLVKLGNYSVAERFCVEHKLTNRPAILIQELKLVEPNKTIHFNKMVPTLVEKQNSYHDEIVKQKQIPSIQTQPSLTKLSNQTTKKTGISIENKLLKVRTGEHKSFSRITFETSNKLNASQYSVTKLADNNIQVVISNIEHSDLSIERLINKIKISNRNFVEVNADYKDKKLILKIKTKNIGTFKVFYSGTADNHGGHCLVFDFYLIK